MLCIFSVPKSAVADADTDLRETINELETLQKKANDAASSNETVGDADRDGENTSAY